MENDTRMTDRMFLMDGEIYCLADMLDGADGDDYVCDWLRSAAIGDVLDGGAAGVLCERIADRVRP